MTDVSKGAIPKYTNIFRSSSYKLIADLSILLNPFVMISSIMSLANTYEFSNTLEFNPDISLESSE